MRTLGRMRGEVPMTAIFLGIGRGCPFLTGQKGTKNPPGRPDGTGFSLTGAPRPRKVRYVSFPADAENCTSLPCSSLPPLAFGHFPLTGGIGLSQPDPLTLGSGWGPITHSRPLCCRPRSRSEGAKAPTEKGAWCPSAVWCGGGRRFFFPPFRRGAHCAPESLPLWGRCPSAHTGADEGEATRLPPQEQDPAGAGPLWVGAGRLSPSWAGRRA